jgi:hypothetical protein
LLTPPLNAGTQALFRIQNRLRIFIDTERKRSYGRAMVIGGTSEELRVVLALVSNRIFELVRRELWFDEETRKACVALLESSQSDSFVLDKFAELIRKKLGNKDFKSSFATCITTRELEEVFWVRTAETLMAKRSCTFANFGTFMVKPSARSVAFEPETFLVSANNPRIDYLYWQDDQVAIDVSQFVLSPLIEQSAGAPDNSKGPANLAAHLLADAISGIYSRLDQISVASLRLPKSEGYLSFVCYVWAHAAYHAYISACSLWLQRTGLFSVSNIGSFERERGEVKFSPAPEFLRLVWANVPPLAANASA